MNCFCSKCGCFIGLDLTNVICDSVLVMCSRLSICVVCPSWAETKDINMTAFILKVLNRNILGSRYCLKMSQDCPYIPCFCVSWCCWSGFETHFRNLVTVGSAPNIMQFTGFIYGTVTNTFIIQLDKEIWGLGNWGINTTDTFLMLIFCPYRHVWYILFTCSLPLWL